MNVIPEFMGLWKQKFQARGLVLSSKRQVIIAAIVAQGGINDVEGFWLELRQEHKISWATYYGFIRIFKQEEWLIKHGDRFVLPVLIDNKSEFSKRDSC